MEWKTLAELKPPYTKKVLVFRVSNERYTIASLQLLKEEDDQSKEHWVTEWGSAFHPDENDSWVQFTYYTYSKTYA